MLYHRKRKITAALLCWLLGFFGAHRFYLGRTKTAIAQLMAPIVFFITGIATFVLTETIRNSIVQIVCGVAGIAAGLYLFAVTIWLLVDLIRILLENLIPADGQAYVRFEPAVEIEVDPLPESFSAADSGVMVIDRLYALYLKGAITEQQYLQKLHEFRTRM